MGFPPGGRVVIVIMNEDEVEVEEEDGGGGGGQCGGRVAIDWVIVGRGLAAAFSWTRSAEGRGSWIGFAVVRLWLRRLV